MEIWKFLAGLGLFLYGMGLMESVLKNVSSRSFKLFLKRNTQNVFKAIVGGTVVTSIVQSSTVVSLIVLAFVETGIITFRNALAVILGANLGTTLTGWLVVLIGFKLDIIVYALPVIAIAALGSFAFDKLKNIRNLFLFLFAIGILFLGLGYMKEGANLFVKEFDLTPYTQYGTFVFVIIGFFLTSIIQSSSAAVAITLTALYAGVITFPSAASIVIGAEVGTTLTILLWGVKGSADKKRTAWGNFGFNIFTAITAFIILHLLINFYDGIDNMQDPLIGLVLFQTSINIISIALFIPFLNIFANWLERKFITDNSNGNSYISKNLPVLPILATDAFRKETIILLNKVRVFNKNILCFEKNMSEGLLENLKSFTKNHSNIEDEYQRLKQTEGDILQYYANIQESYLAKEDTTLILQYINAARQCVFAAKAIKDIAHNLNDFEASANDILHHQCAIIRNEWIEFDTLINQLLNFSEKQNINTEIEQVLNEALAQEEKLKSEVFTQLKNNQLYEVEASTLMNVHREMLSCKKSFLLALNNLEKETFTKTQ